MPSFVCPPVTEQTYQRLEQINSDLEKVNSLDTGLVVRVARRLNGGDTSSVGGPLVLPEFLIGLVVAVPVRVHVVQELRRAVLLDKRGDIIVVTARVAVLRVGAIAVVGPQAVDTPGVGGT